MTINITISLTDVIITIIQTLLIVWIVKMVIHNIPSWMEAYEKKKQEKEAIKRAMGLR